MPWKLFGDDSDKAKKIPKKTDNVTIHDFHKDIKLESFSVQSIIIDAKNNIKITTTIDIKNPMYGKYGIIINYAAKIIEL